MMVIGNIRSAKCRNLVVYILIMVLLSSCYPHRHIGLVQDRKGLPTYEKGEFKQYRLQKNDEIRIKVITTHDATEKIFKNSNRLASNAQGTSSYRIYEDGTIDMPLLNSVKVEGLTLDEAEAFLEEQLAEYAGEVHVRVALASGMFCVIGDAGRGYFPVYKEHMTIYQALALCGGLHKTADFAHVKILRSIDGETKIVEFDIRTDSIIESEYYYIYPNDVIYVDTSYRRFWGMESAATFIGTISTSLSMILLLYNNLK